MSSSNVRNKEGSTSDLTKPIGSGQQANTSGEPALAVHQPLGQQGAGRDQSREGDARAGRVPAETEPIQAQQELRLPPS
jgi:hypothetical protein